MLNFVCKNECWNIYHFALIPLCCTNTRYIKENLKKMTSESVEVVSSSKNNYKRLLDNIDIISFDLGTLEIGDNIFVNLVYDQELDDFYVSLIEEDDNNEREIRRITLKSGQMESLQNVLPKVSLFTFYLCILIK